MSLWSHCALQSHGELDDESLKVKLQEAATSIESNHHQLVASRADTMGHLIGPGRKLEIEAACRAAISACWKLINSFRGPIQQHIVIEAKVSACTISQLSTTLTEVAKVSSFRLDFGQVLLLLDKVNLLICTFYLSFSFLVSVCCALRLEYKSTVTQEDTRKYRSWCFGSQRAISEIHGSDEARGSKPNSRNAKTSRSCDWPIISANEGDDRAR